MGVGPSTCCREPHQEGPISLGELRALIELWHPQTHTFVFPSFEATVLLEEVEILLGLKSSVDHDIACPLGDFQISEVLGEFMTEKEVRKVSALNGMDLFRFAN